MKYGFFKFRVINAKASDTIKTEVYLGGHVEGLHLPIKVSD